MNARANRETKLIVVIDDDPLVLEATAGLLQSWGCKVVTAVSYPTAMQQLKNLGRPDLIVCDYHLHGSNGVEVIKHLRSAFEIPALLISGEAVPPTFDGKVVSGYHMLQKPLEPTRLRAALVGASVLQT